MISVQSIAIVMILIFYNIKNYTSIIVNNTIWNIPTWGASFTCKRYGRT